MANVEAEGVRLDALAEELATIASTATEARAEGLTGVSRPYGILLLMVAALALAVHAGAMAWLESGYALRTTGITTRAVPHIPGVTPQPDSAAGPDNDTEPAAINKGDSEDAATDPGSNARSGGAEAGAEVHAVVLQLREPSDAAAPVAGAAA